MGLQHFLVQLLNILTALNHMNWMQYIVFWDNVSFHPRPGPELVSTPSAADNNLT